MRGTRGIQLFLEYFDNDEANAKSFTEDGWFKTGDNVTMSADGYLYFRDRDKDALKVGGENVSAREVEDVCRQVPGIADIAVVGQKHDFLDQVAGGLRRARRRARPTTCPSRSSTTAPRSSPTSRCPRAVYLVDEFPTATLDKVAKNKLREMADARLDQA